MSVIINYAHMLQQNKSTRYPTNMTDAKWMLIEPFIPPPKKGGRPRETDMREVINAVFYINKAGCQWRMLPNDFPNWPIVYYYFRAWKKDGTWKKIHDAMRGKVRAQAGKKRTTFPRNH